MDYEKINAAFYNQFFKYFEKLPFEDLLPSLILKYGKGREVLEIGSGSGSLALWLQKAGYNVLCVEPAESFVKECQKKGLLVVPSTIQQFVHELNKEEENTRIFDMVFAISSLIHVPKKEMKDLMMKLAALLKPKGLFFVSFILGAQEGLEDPTHLSCSRFFARWEEGEWLGLMAPYFKLVENHALLSKKMDCTFMLHIYQKE